KEKKEKKEKSKKSKKDSEDKENSESEESNSESESERELEDDPDTQPPVKKKKVEEKPVKDKERSKHGIWIGNLSFKTTKGSLNKFFSTCGEVTRIHLPLGSNGNRGFAYVDFTSEEEVEAAIALSEQELDGRQVLIKNSKDFNKSGRPSTYPTTESSLKGTKKHKHDASPTLFLGNLSFNTTREGIQALFEDCGKIIKVRLATFEDTGKCKGFAYVDFEEVESATKAIEDSNKQWLDGRKLRVEYGSAEATKKGAPWLHDKKRRDGEGEGEGQFRGNRRSGQFNQYQEFKKAQQGEEGQYRGYRRNNDGNDYRQNDQEGQDRNQPGNDEEGNFKRQRRRRREPPQKSTSHLPPPKKSEAPVPFQGKKIVFE
ncbi:Nucleolar protein 13, partial [Basidiobolus ranarum]